MIGNDWIEIIVEDDSHGFDFHRVTIAFEDMINAFGQAVFPSVCRGSGRGNLKTGNDVKILNIYELVALSFLSKGA